MPDHETNYILEDQVGFLLRQVTQRHVGIFADHMPEHFTPPQFAALATLLRNGACSQNHLGRLIATDGATIKGIIDRLTKRGLTQTAADPTDGRMLIVSLTATGQRIATACITAASRITAATLAPLDHVEKETLLELLKKLR